MKLWLARHAAVQVPPGVCYGASDLPAERDATQAAAQALAAALPHGVALHTSPLQRCEHLAQHLRQLRPDLAGKPDARLQEMDFGTWELQPWIVIGEPAVQAWTQDFWHHRPGGGESVQAFMQRVGHAFDETVSCETDAVWITHAGVIRAAHLLARGIRQVGSAGQWPLEAPGVGRWSVLELRNARD